MPRSAYSLDNYPSNAVPSTLSAPISAGATSFNISPATNWSATNLWAVIDRSDNSAAAANKEELVWIQTNSAGALTNVARGQGGTTDTDHADGAPIEVVVAGVALAEMSKAVNETVGKVTAAEDLLKASGANTLARLAKGSNSTLLKTKSDGTVGYEKALAADLDTSLGRVHLVATTAARDALTGLREGDVCDVAANDLYYSYTGAAWVPMADQQIARTTLSVAAATIDFSSITQEFGDLEVSYLLRSSDAAALVALIVRMNNDSGNNYYSQILNSTNATASAGEDNAATSGQLADIPAGAASAGHFGRGTASVVHYASTVAMKGMTCVWFVLSSGTVTSVGLKGFDWSGAGAAINRLTFLPMAGNFTADSTIRLIGKGRAG